MSIGVIIALQCLSLAVIVFLLWRAGKSKNDGQLLALRERIDLGGQHTREKLEEIRKQSGEDGRHLREEVQAAVHRFGGVTSLQVDELSKRLLQQGSSASEKQSKELAEQKNVLGQVAQATQDGLGKMTLEMTNQFEQVRRALNEQLERLRKQNESKLEEMRVTVDEKLQGTLENRLGKSFKIVSERLEQVHRGLGEMQELAVNVGDLKKVMTNVKTRGTWGEVQLGGLLEQFLTVGQYGKNVATNPLGGERVEFAIKIPHPTESNKVTWLPLDSKFPVEDYYRLQSAREAGDEVGVLAARKELVRQVTLCAKSIRDKYICPPHTVDFAILFVPSESIFAELLSTEGVMESIQQDQRVTIAGPNNLAAILTSFQLGFRALALQQRSSEVWDVLSAVKTEFRKFGEVLTKIEKKLESAQKEIGNARRRERVMERTLRGVDELPMPVAPVAAEGSSQNALLDGVPEVS